MNWETVRFLIARGDNDLEGNTLKFRIDGKVRTISDDTGVLLKLPKDDTTPSTNLEADFATEATVMLALDVGGDVSKIKIIA